MSNYINAEPTQIVSGDPVNDVERTVQFSGDGTMSETAGVGGALTYFHAQFDNNEEVKKVKALIKNVTRNSLANEAKGDVYAHLLKNQDKQAEVSIGTYILGEMISGEFDPSNDFVFRQVEGHNGNTVNEMFDTDITDVEVVLQGFNLSFENSHQVKRLKAISKNENLATDGNFSFTVEANLIDDSDHTGGGDFLATLIGTNVTNPPWVKQTWMPKDGEITVISGGSTPLRVAYVFAQGVVIKYKGHDDHKVKKMVINTGNGDLQIIENSENEDGSYTWSVSFKPQLIIRDDSENKESQSDSYLDLLVVFVAS